MKFTYVGATERKSIQVSTGEICVLERGVSREVPDELAQKLLNTPEYQCDDPKVVAEQSKQKADEKAASKQHK